MLIKLTNSKGKKFVINSYYIVEANIIPSASNQLLKTAIVTSMANKVFEVEETIDQILSLIK